MGTSFDPSTSAAALSSTPSDPYSVCTLPGRPVSCSSLDSGDGQRALSRGSDVVDSLPLGDVQERSTGICRTEMNAKSRYVTGPVAADGVPLTDVSDGVEVKKTCVNASGDVGMSVSVRAGRDENSAAASVVSKDGRGNLYGGVVGYSSEEGPKVAAQVSSSSGGVVVGVGCDGDGCSGELSFKKEF